MGPFAPGAMSRVINVDIGFLIGGPWLGTCQFVAGQRYVRQGFLVFVSALSVAVAGKLFCVGRGIRRGCIFVISGAAGRIQVIHGEGSRSCRWPNMCGPVWEAAINNSSLRVVFSVLHCLAC